MLIDRKTYVQRNFNRIVRQIIWYSYWYKEHLQHQIQNQTTKIRQIHNYANFF